MSLCRERPRSILLGSGSLQELAIVTLGDVVTEMVLCDWLVQ